MKRIFCALLIPPINHESTRHPGRRGRSRRGQLHSRNERPRSRHGQSSELNGVLRSSLWINNGTLTNKRTCYEQMHAAMESCPFKTVLSGGMGFALGGAFGLFMSSVSFFRYKYIYIYTIYINVEREEANKLINPPGSHEQMSYDTPMSGAGQQMADLPLKEQLRRGFKDMGTRSFSSAKNFGLVGAIFAGTECCIEGVCLSSIVLGVTDKGFRS